MIYLIREAIKTALLKEINNLLDPHKVRLSYELYNRIEFVRPSAQYLGQQDFHVITLNRSYIKIESYAWYRPGVAITVDYADPKLFEKIIIEFQTFCNRKYYHDDD